MAPPTRLCHICGRAFPTPVERERHREAEHPGVSVRWTGPNARQPIIVHPDGTEEPITKARLKAMRARARAEAELPAPPPAPDPMTEPPSDPPPAPRVRERGREARPPRITQGSVPVGPSRASLAEAFPRSALASIVRQFSASISQLDGAGEAGTLSLTEAAQIADLIHDATLDAIGRYFGGNVDRFKVAMAVAIILLAKGKIHADAIRTRMAERRAAASVTAADTIATWAAPDTVEYVPVPPPPENGHAEAPVAETVPADPIAALAARQRAARIYPTGN